MAMKTLILIVIQLLPCHILMAQMELQTPSPTWHVKLEPSELAFDFPRIGIGVEKKFSRHSIWTSFHYGTEELHFGNKSFYYTDPFHFWGLKAGIKRIFPDGLGEYFIGPQLSFDKVSGPVSHDVFYDLRNNDAILFDSAFFHRDRIMLFLDNGYEWSLGNRFTIETSFGAGISRIHILYKDVENPFLL